MTTRAGIVLAGGRSTRMGRPKASIELAGCTLTHRAADMLRAVGCDPVLVVEGGDEGPLAALLEPMVDLEADDVYVLACDLPLAAPVVERLVENSIAVDDQGREQPLCSRWSRATALEFLERVLPTGERRMSALVDAMEPARVQATADELLNVNTPADLAKAAELLFEN